MKIKIDSRTIESGDYFIPVKGPVHDGRDFIKEVEKKGGILLDVDLHDYTQVHRRTLTCPVIGVTGSAGKTTVKDLIAALLSSKYRVKKTLENQNNEVGVPLTVLSADDDTDVLVVEMGIRKKGDMTLLEQLVVPTHVVVTNIGLTHAEFLSSSEEIAEEKGQIFQKRPYWLKGDRIAYIQKNGQTPILVQKAVDAGFTVVEYTAETKAEENLVLAELIAKSFGLSEDEKEKGLAGFETSSHRMKRHQVGKTVLIDDTYNANPDGVRYALECLSREEGQKALILGSMLELGAQSKEAHLALIPKIKAAGVRQVYTVGTETQCMQGDHEVLITHFESKEALESAVKKDIRELDVILIKGSRGLKMESIVTCLING